MPIDIYAPTDNDALSAQELALYHLLMDYRAANGLPAIPLSASLTLTAGRHAVDTYQNIWLEGVTLPDGANLHSWSDAHYYADHSAAEVMWNAPSRLGTSYPSNGYEITAAGFASIEAALAGWQSSPGHDAVILNEGIWEDNDWSAIGVGIEYHTSGGPYGGRIYHVWFGTSADPAGGPEIFGTDGSDSMTGTAAGDTIRALDGADTVIGGEGDDFLFGGDSADDLRDVIYGGAGDDSIDGGYGNDELRGDAGNDTITGGFGADTVIGGTGDDALTGQAWSDAIFGGDGDDFINGGFGHDRVNGGAGADRFFHLGADGHGSDWIQDYSAAEGDRLVYGGGAAVADDFLVQRATTPGAGAAGVQEIFITHIPSGDLLWALVDGDAQASITVTAGGTSFDLLG
ncbi:hypothetical protein [Salipiger abyssi]|uniref:hypothetical protein n=1 Tax=Salipiger abyssi TaxID=1250539 RepID=UPI004057E588